MVFAIFSQFSPNFIPTFQIGGFLSHGGTPSYHHPFMGISIETFKGDDFFPSGGSQADIVCVLGLPLRASVGFVFQPVPQTWYEEAVQVTLIFFLPIFR